jgi:hypothetical protein
VTIDVCCVIVNWQTRYSLEERFKKSSTELP